MDTPDPRRVRVLPRRSSSATDGRSSSRSLTAATLRPRSPPPRAESGRLAAPSGRGRLGRSAEASLPTAPSLEKAPLRDVAGTGEPDDSGSSTDVGQAGPERRRVLAARARQVPALSEAWAEAENERSYLEKKAVTPRVRMVYDMTLSAFIFWAEGENLKLTKDTEVGEALVAYFSLLYFSGYKMDSTWLQWLAPIPSILAEGGKGKCVWNFDYPAYVREFRSALARLRVTGVVPYMMRHSGPSIDRSRGWRSQDEVQKRGRWKSHRSLTRYEKHARLGHTMLSYTAEQQAHSIDCEAHIADIVLGRKHPVVANIRG